MAWIFRGIREGVVTTRYPRRPDDYGQGFRAGVVVTASDRGTVAPPECPTGAIVDDGDTIRLDRGRCIVCGHCVGTQPERFAFSPELETATVGRSSLVVPVDPAAERDALSILRASLAERVRFLGRSVHIRHVDAGSDGCEEWEIAALVNPIYDVQRLGIFFTASPRHADLLLVTGVGTAGMAEPLRRTYEAMPEPRIVLAAGTDAISGGIVGTASGPDGSEPFGRGIGEILPVDVFVPGSPPSPFSVLHGILIGIGRLTPATEVGR
jgi:Ni,Fe-hydrogenase III small subunit/ferredoxin